MIEAATPSVFDFPIVCHAEVDLPSWLKQLTGKTGWKLCAEEEAEMYDAYSFSRAGEDAEIVLFHTGYATVEVGDRTLYDGSLLSVPSCAKLHYFNAESGEPILAN